MSKFTKGTPKQVKLAESIYNKLVTHLRKLQTTDAMAIVHLSDVVRTTDATVVIGIYFKYFPTKVMVETIAKKAEAKRLQPVFDFGGE